MRKLYFLLAVLPLFSTTSNALDVSGSFDYQHDYYKTKYAKSRHRQRLRAYLTGKHNVNELSTVTFGLASGPQSPTNDFQTLGDAFSSKLVWIDQANARVSLWKKHQLSTTFGKMINPFTRVGGSELQWDSDVRPEGISVNFNNKEVMANIGGFYLEERSNDEDSLLLGGDVFFPINMNEKSSIKLGVGIYAYTQLKGKTPVFDSTNTYGNSAIINSTGATPVYTYAENYTILNPGLELNTRLMDTPFQVFFDFVYNTEASDDNTGWSFGAQLGQIKKRFDFTFGASFTRKEADAVLGALTQSSFYSQTTGTQGFTLNASMGLLENTKVGIKWLSTDLINSPKARQNRVQLSANMKF